MSLLTQHAYDIIVRLVGGQSARDGMVQVYHRHTWGWICAQGWDKKDADVVCRELGLEASSAFFIDVTHHNDDNGIWWLSNVQCVGNETSIFSCSHDGWKKRHSWESKGKASVVCVEREGA